MNASVAVSGNASLVVLGEILHFTGDPSQDGSAATHHHADGALLIRDGRIVAAGDASTVMPLADPGSPITAAC